MDWQGVYHLVNNMYVKIVAVMKFLLRLLFFFLALLLLAGCQEAWADQDRSILFQDDFSSEQANWDDYEVDNGAAGYQNGIYRIFANEAQTDFRANPHGLKFTDVRIEVDALRVAGSENNVFGILCRYRDVKNFYQLLVSSDGYYDISKVIGNQRIPLTGEQLLPSEAIPQDLDILKLRADCTGSQLVLFVNDVEIARAQDSDLASGNVGLLAGAFETPGTEIYFDNFVVRKP
jgi:hypothetical protein